MRMPWQRATPAQRLAAAAGLRRVGDADVGRLAALEAGRRDGPTAAALAVIEELTDDELVLSFLEDLQNVVSHGLPQFRTPDEVEQLLGPQGAVRWAALMTFWTEVWAFAVETGADLATSESLRSIKNEQLQALLWTSNRTVGDQRIGLAAAVRYERATGRTVPGFGHLDAARRAAEGLS